MSYEKTELVQPQITDKIPLVPFKVIEAGIPFYSDPECENEVRDAQIVIIQALDPEDDIQELDIVPSTQMYQPGQYVSFGLEHKKVWSECWYRDPQSGEITQAWKVHVNFIGDVISRNTLQKEKDRISELEIRMKQRIDSIAQKRNKRIN
jgi:hypothetical protein